MATRVVTALDAFARLAELPPSHVDKSVLTEPAEERHDESVS